MQQNQFKKKIDYLIITIEALDLYSEEYKHKQSKYLYYKNDHIVSRLQLGNRMRHPKYNKKCKFEESIESIYRINNLINNKYIQYYTTIILNNYSKNVSCNLTKQYIKRFIFLYQKTQNYYNNLSNYMPITIQELSLANLYIINEINQNKGIYILLKYLCIENL